MNWYHEQLPTCIDWQTRDNNAMHAKPGLRASFFCLQDYRPGSVIADVIRLGSLMTNPYARPKTETDAQKKRRRRWRKFVRGFKNPIVWLSALPVAIYFGTKTLILLLTGK